MRAKFLWALALGVICGVALAGSATGAGAPVTSGTSSGAVTKSGPSVKVAPLAGFTLYDQYNNASSAASSSQNFEAAQNAFDDEVADDFVVPAGQTWSISQVDVQGLYFNGPGPAASFNVSIYGNAGTLPGSVVTTRSGLGFAQTTTNFAIPVSPAIVLPAGTYWLAVQANQNFSPAGQWGWQDRTVQTGQGAAFHAPGGGFGAQCVPWVRKSPCVATTAPDQVFKLTGSINGAPGTWAPDAPMPLDLYGGGTVWDGKNIFVLGGYSFSLAAAQATVHRFDPATNTWDTRAVIPAITAVGTAVYYPSAHRIYLFGGFDGGSNVYGTTRVYDVGANAWSLGTAMPAPRDLMAGAYNPANGKIYLVAGNSTTSAASATNTLWEFDPTAAGGAGSFTAKAPIPHALSGAVAGISNGHLYVTGGRDGSSNALNLTWDYDIGANTWTARANLPTAANVAGGAMAGGKLYVFGGGNPFAPTSPKALAFSAGSVYDPASNAWSALQSLPSARSFVGATFGAGKVWSIGGYNGTTTINDVQALTVPAPSGVTFTQNFDGVTAPALPAGWTASQGLNTLSRPPWVTSSTGTPTPVADSAPNALFSEDASNILDNRIDTPSLGIRTRYPILTFRQNRNLESTFDGGVLEISVDGGAFRDIIDAGGSFISGGYDSKISTGFSSPIAGRHAWSGNSSGFVTTAVALPDNLAGHSVVLRFRMGSDSSIAPANSGWRIDSVQLQDGNLLSLSKSGNGSGTISSAPGGLACGATCANTFEIGSSVTLTAAADTGSTFTGWSGAGCSGTGTCTVTMDAAKSVSASFALQSFALNVTKAGSGAGTVTSSPAGISCPATCSASYLYNTSVTLTASPGGKSRFGGWTGDCSGTSTCVVSMTAAHSVTATFLPPLAPPACKVPKVIGKSLAKAKTAIKKAHCKVGKISHKASTAKKKGKVIGQTPKAGKKLKNGAKVNVTVGTGPKKKKK